MEKETQKKHNGVISLWKFIFSIMIILYHYATSTEWQYFKNGYLGVEFFFIVSGYLMTKSALKVENKEIGKTTWKYIWRKVKELFPYILIAYVISIFVKSSFREFKTYQYVRSIWNLLLVDMSGIVTTYMLGQTWYISAMLISMLILYPLIIKYKKNFIYLIAPIIVLFVGGYVSHVYGELNLAYTWNGLVQEGILRALFELSLGAISYEIVEKMKKINFTRIGKVLLTLIEILGIVIVFIIACRQSKNYDFIALGLLTISIIIAFSENTIFYKYINNKFFYYLEKLSLPIYLNHIWIKDVIVNNFVNLTQVNQLIVIISLTIAFSIITLFVVEKLKGRVAALMKKIFVVQQVNENIR